MTIKKYTEPTPENVSTKRYQEEVYIDAVTDTGSSVKVVDTRRSRIVTVAQLESERDSSQAEADNIQAKLDQITAIEESE